MDYDILVRGGLVLDGTGSPGRQEDVAIRSGRIAAVARGLAGKAVKVIDAGGLAVAPGFIDIKTHSDFTLPINPKAESKVRQGVTTEIVGHCGFSVAPALAGKVDLLRDYLRPERAVVAVQGDELFTLSRQLPSDGGQCGNAGWA